MYPSTGLVISSCSRQINVKYSGLFTNCAAAIILLQLSLAAATPVISTRPVTEWVNMF